ncbi:MAG: hypothetical protein QM739_15465 [Propionivibrio sp.]
MTPKTRTHLCIVATLSLLAGCSTTGDAPGKPSSGNASATYRQPEQLNFKLASGTYRCELGKKIEVRRDARKPDQIGIDWQGKRHLLQRYDSTSGLPRYEDRENGLVWIDLPWKSVLMDARSGSPLANECKAARG